MNNLSKNIRYLRKSQKLSQQQLADSLGVKRSNIAAYETKGVEPRLALINEMAVFFQVPLSSLITSDLSQRHGQVTKVQSAVSAVQSLENVSFTLNGQQAPLREHAQRISKMLEGFRVFYEYKRDSVDTSATGSDIENFLVLVSHMHAYNEQIDALFNPSFSEQENNEVAARSEKPQVKVAAGGH